MKKSKRLAAILVSLIMLVVLCPAAYADDWYGEPGGYYTVNTQDGQLLFTFGGQVFLDDEYISQDNRRFRVVQVDDSSQTAIARYVEDVVLWEGFSADMLNVRTVAQGGQKRVAIYCSHTDESYVPSDGTEAKQNGGGILDVANSLADNLKSKGVDAMVDDTSHEPHDAGAYRRSRQTAVNLMEQGKPDMLLDIHRDGVPDPKEYTKEINGKTASKMRIVVGRSNQNKNANEETAKKLKQIADSEYPGLIKDIYIGKGSYNQDLMPNAILLEFGTHTIEKERALESTKFTADIVAKYLGASGGQPGGTQGPAQGENKQPSGQQQSAQQQQNARANKTGVTSAVWIVLAVVGAGLLFLVVALSSNRKERAGHFFKELTGTGKKPKE